MRLTPEDVRYCLVSTEGIRQVARKLGCSRQAVTAVRRGLSHGDLWPELPRRGAQRGIKSGRNCWHWDNGSCLLGLPDPLSKGPACAQDCALFEQL
jgi:hypothetical protein